MGSHWTCYSGIQLHWRPLRVSQSAALTFDQ